MNNNLLEEQNSWSRMMFYNKCDAGQIQASLPISNRIIFYKTIIAARTYVRVVSALLAAL